MPANLLLVEKAAIEVSQLPKDITGAAQAGDYYSLKNFESIAWIISQGAWAGGTPAVTLNQATDVAGTSAKTLGFSYRWTKVAITGTTWTKTAVTSNTFNLPAVANTINVVCVNATDLDVSNGFDCCSLDVATPGSNADLLCVIAVLFPSRFEMAQQLDAKID